MGFIPCLQDMPLAAAVGENEGKEQQWVPVEGWKQQQEGRD